MQKLGPHLVFFRFSVGCYFYAFLGCLLVISGFSMDIDLDSLSFLNYFAECWLVGSFQLSFTTLGQASSYAIVHYLPRCLHSAVTCGKTPTP